MVKIAMSGCLMLLIFITGALSGFWLKRHDQGGGATSDLGENNPLDIAMVHQLDGLSPCTATARIYYNFEDEWDKRLNDMYWSWMLELPVDEQRVLRDAQRAWIKCRDADKALIRICFWPTGESFTPTMYQSFAAYRIMNLTRTRSMMLTKLYRIRGDILNEVSGVE